MLKRTFALLFFLFVISSDAASQLNKDYFFYVGQKFISENKYSDAIETLNTLLKFDTTAYEGYFLRGIAKYNLDDLHGAEDDLSLAINKNPVYTIAYRVRAITRSRLGNYNDALKDFKETIDLRPDMADGYYSRGVTYLRSGRFKEAIDDFNEVIKHNPKVSEVYINKGICYISLKDTTSALENFNIAIRTNRLNPEGYNRRGSLYLATKNYNGALEDFNKAIECDSLFIGAYFNRAIVHSNNFNLLGAINDLTKVVAIDSTISLAYFNRALVRSQIGDYNNALRDYDRVTRLSPNNVLVYYNRALLNSRLGFIDNAITDYTKAIDLYPDFANAYLGRAELKYSKRDVQGSLQDKKIADRKIAEYRSKLTDSTFSIYADTSQQFNKLLSFDNISSRKEFGNSEDSGKDITLLPLFQFTITNTVESDKYIALKASDFITQSGITKLALTNRESDISSDSVFIIDRTVAHNNYFLKGITQSLIRQYTSSISNYTKAIENQPANPFLYINRSTTRSEMTDFISSIDNGYSNISIDSDPVNRLKQSASRTYSYDDAIEDLNKAAKLMPDFAHIYYNRANLHCLSGNMAAALEDYTLAIELYPYFAQAYYNRGLVQIYLKDTKKGYLDISKAGELGVKEAYETLRKYTATN